MDLVTIRDMGDSDKYFVGTCTHVNDTPNCLLRCEIDYSAKRRIAWLQNLYNKNVRTKVACINDEPVGFMHLIPIEVCPWGPIGDDLLVIPCLVVLSKTGKRGIGKKLLALAEEEALSQGFKGLATICYYHSHWFMPAGFFEKCGFKVAKRKNEEAILWKVYDPSVKEPTMLTPDYNFKCNPDRVTIDLFWNTFCPTSSIEAQRVREVAEEFGDKIVLNEYCADDRRVFLRYQLPRGIFVNGKEVWYGHEAPKEGIRKTILKALEK
ncbi:MAG: GNAT family N-acetyltransferase [Candidatus Methanofastidiosia archaeon]